MQILLVLKTGTVLPEGGTIVPKYVRHMPLIFICN